jgi:hypothetical protein
LGSRVRQRVGGLRCGARVCARHPGSWRSAPCSWSSWRGCGQGSSAAKPSVRTPLPWWFPSSTNHAGPGELQPIAGAHCRPRPGSFSGTGPAVLFASAPCRASARTAVGDITCMRQERGFWRPALWPTLAHVWRLNRRSSFALWRSQMHEVATLRRKLAVLRAPMDSRGTELQGRTPRLPPGKSSQSPADKYPLTKIEGPRRAATVPRTAPAVFFSEGTTYRRSGSNDPTTTWGQQPKRNLTPR